MSLKFGLTIGAIWTGAAAFTASEKALKALKNRGLQLNQKKLDLKGDSRAIAGINWELGKLDQAITRINNRKLKLDQIAQQRQQFKSSLMEKALLAGAVIAGFPACAGMNRVDRCHRVWRRPEIPVAISASRQTDLPASERKGRG